MGAMRVALERRGETVLLVIRARFERTFFGLRAFAGTILMAKGLYLMSEALVDPFGNTDVRGFVAGTALALSGFLLVYLLWPRR
jgi:hypothetical protein